MNKNTKYIDTDEPLPDVKKARERLARGSQRADREADKLFKSKNPIVRQYMQDRSNISPKSEALQDYEHYSKIDSNAPAEKHRDHIVINIIKNIHTKYVTDVIGCEPVRPSDVKIAKKAVAQEVHDTNSRFRSLAGLVLTPSERHALMNHEHGTAYQSALRKLGFVK